MHGRSVRTAGGNHALRLLAAEDEQVASLSRVTLLITAQTQQHVESLARRIHCAGPRAQLPFIQIGAAEFPVDSEALRKYCLRLLDAAAGGTVLVSAVEEMPAAVQDAWLDLLAGSDVARGPSRAARLISGTTVSLLDRIAAGAFSDQLFYRLNVIHLVPGTCTPDAPTS